jgi:uncharacterized protein YycO
MYNKGDIILVTDNDLSAKIIKFGTRSHWCHVAMIVDKSGTLVEAVNSGVQYSHISAYDHLETRLIDVGLSDIDRERAVAFAISHVGNRYDWIDIASIGMTQVFRSKISFTTEGHFICSGLIGEALERGGVSFPKEGNTLFPGDLAKFYNILPY